MGMVLSFRNLLHEALQYCLQTRVPFIFGAIKDLHTFAPHSQVGCIRQYNPAAPCVLTFG